MIAFGDTIPIIQGIMFVLFTLVLLVDIECVAYSIKIKVKLQYALIVLALFVVTFLSLIFLDIGYVAEYRMIEVNAFIKYVYELPVIAVTAFIVILSALSIFALRTLLKWRETHLSALSIKESIDELPSGLCYYNENGLPLLMNNEISTDCMSITGRALLNANEFWAAIVGGFIIDGNNIVVGGDKPIIKLQNGTVKSFVRNERKENNSIFYEIKSTNITEEYALSLERENKNEILKKMNESLREYGKQINALTREKEVLAAKIRIHDETGRLLLATQRSITQPHTRKALLSSWAQTVTAFGIVDEESEQSKPIDDLIVAAKDSGVTIDYVGVRPNPNSIAEKIISNALHECLTNTILHSDGNSMTVIVNETKRFITLQITNNGEQPKSDIKEGGGLSSLRAFVE